MTEYLQAEAQETLGDGQSTDDAGAVRCCGELHGEEPSWHTLKTWPPYFEAVFRGGKSFEVRRDDRGYALGHWLILAEWDPETERFTGRQTTRQIAYILRGGAFGIEPGYVVLGLFAV